MFHILTDKNIGGAGRWLLSYLKHYNREIFDVSVVLPKNSLLYPMIVALRIPVISLEDMEDKSFDKKGKIALKQLFLKESPDIVHTHASLSARMAAKEAKVPLIFNTKHCMESTSRPLWKKILRREVNKRYSHKIIAVSQAVRESVILGGTDPKQVVTIYNGIDPLFPLSQEEKGEILKFYGGNPEKKSVGIVARLEEVKDHETFLLGAKAVLEKRQDILFYIIGEGSLKEKLKHRAIELEIETHVIFTGFVEQIESLVAALDLNIITSKEEALCISLIEGMSVGIPAIGTNSGGVGEVICHEKNGYLIPVGDWKELGNKIQVIFEDEKQYEVMKENAKQWAEKHFNAKTMTEKIERLYLEVSP